MADTLTNIQTDIRFWANDRELVVTTGDNLRIFNNQYQGMFDPEYVVFGVKIGRRWPEATVEDTSLTMVVGVEDTYTWPTSPVFKDPTWLEGLDVNSSEPYPIHWAPDMSTWSAYDDSGNAQPLYARLITVSSTVKLALRPKPVQADTIRITGLKEITELTTGASTTIFRNKGADRALAKVVAAQFLAKRGKTNRALELVQLAASELPTNDTTPNLTGSGRVTPWNYSRGYARHS